MSDHTQNRIRTVLLWVTLAVTAGLTVLSIVGSFMGPERTRAAVNGPMAIVWIVLATFVMTSIIWSSNILRRWSSLCMHAGVVLVLIGSMYNSPAGHTLAGRILGATKPFKGYMQIDRCGDTNELCDEDGKPIAHLPFSLQLKDFSIEYYPLMDGDWELWAVAAYSQPHSSAGGLPHSEPVQLHWKVGQLVAIPGTVVALRVIEYLPAARPTFDGPERNLTGAQADPESDVPAMKLAIKRPDGQEATAWLVVRHGQSMAGFSLRDVLGSEAAGGDVGIYLVRPQSHSPVKAYRSEVEVIEGGKTVAREVIEVNHPLHYGGYHFNQFSYDVEGGRYTVLSVTSDTGLWVVYVGMALVVLGVFGFCWIVPAIAFLRGRMVCPVEGP